jgi:23S rRNA (cytosine1962-C5)-methyltransferase
MAAHAPAPGVTGCADREALRRRAGEWGHGQSAPMKSIRLREGKERSLLRKHPWVFEGSVAKGKADPGETVRVETSEGRFLAWGAFSPTSSIRVRAWSFDEAERIDAAFFQRRIEQAVKLRSRLPIDSDGVRLIHGEADGLPGLIVDRYADVLSAQFLAAGVERWKDAIADALLAATGLTRLYERSDSGVRGLEGLEPVSGWLRGEGDTAVTIREHGWRLTLDVAEGHKTGYYLDQRDNRLRFMEWVQRLFTQDDNVRNVLSFFSLQRTKFEPRIDLSASSPPAP